MQVGAKADVTQSDLSIPVMQCQPSDIVEDGTPLASDSQRGIADGPINLDRPPGTTTNVPCSMAGRCASGKCPVTRPEVPGEGRESQELGAGNDGFAPIVSQAVFDGGNPEGG